LILISTPIYLRYLGVAAYGLVGVSLTLQSIVSLFDFGLSATLSREVARRTGNPRLVADVAGVARRLEVIYWGFAILVGLLLWLAAAWISQHWLRATEIQPVVMTRALRFALLAVTAQLPVGFYAAGLVGLQRQVLNNVLYVATTFLRLIGGAFVAVASNGDVVAFFAWQSGASFLSAIAYASAFWLCVPQGVPHMRAKTHPSSEMWTFTIGMSGITIGILLFNQLDKLSMSRVLLLEQFGYYALAGTVVGSLGALYQPVFATFSPKLAQAAERKDETSLAALYHTSSQLIAATAFPVAVVVFLFAYEFLLAWTGSVHVAVATSRLVQALMPGALLGAITYMPHTLMRAVGWTSMPLAVIGGTLLLLVPSLLLAGGAGGGAVAAMAWSGVVFVQSFFLVWLLHRRLLPREGKQWLLFDVLIPLAATAAIGIVARFLLRPSASVAVSVQSLAIAAIATGVVCVFATPTTRRLVVRQGLSAAGALTVTPEV